MAHRGGNRCAGGGARRLWRLGRTAPREPTPRSSDANERKVGKVMARMKGTHRRLLIAAAAVAIVGTVAAVALGSPGSNRVTTLLVAKGGQQRDRRAEQRPDQVADQGSATDVRVQTITFAPGGYSGWNHKPGFVIVTVQVGRGDRFRCGVQPEAVGRTELAERSRLHRVRRRAGGGPQHEQRAGDGLRDTGCAGRRSGRLPDRGRSATVRVRHRRT